MVDFDQKLWKERAWARLTRHAQAISADDEGEKATIERKWFVDVRAIDDMAKTVAWCTERGLVVSFVNMVNGTYFHESKEITVSSQMRPVNQLTVLLHECGHHLIEKSSDVHGRYTKGFMTQGGADVRSFAHRITCLDEELEAWHRGWKLARKLRLRHAKEDFESFRIECLKSYVKWTLKPRDFRATP